MQISRFHDAAVVIAAQRSKGIWSAETQFRGSSQTIRTGGRLNASTTTASLLCVAMISSLHEIAKKQRIGYRTKVEVRCGDIEFISSLRALIKGQKNETTPFRGGKQFLRELARELSRCQVDLTTVPGDKFSPVLNDWAKTLLLVPLQDDGDSPALSPQVIRSHAHVSTYSV